MSLTQYYEIKEFILKIHNLYYQLELSFPLLIIFSSLKEIYIFKLCLLKRLRDDSLVAINTFLDTCMISQHHLPFKRIRVL